MDRKARDVLADLKIDLSRQPFRGEAAALLDRIVQEYAGAVEAALAWTVARHGSAQQLVRSGNPVSILICPPHVDMHAAHARCGQPAGWRDGVILIQVITVCDKSMIVTTDLESVKAAAPKPAGSHV
jgi:hypothetical protein